MIGGRYRKVRVIGRGGMGEVFLAEDTLLDREVAIKHILRTDEDETTATQRLLREARSAARIHHPSVVAVHDLVVEGDDAYIVMEYVAAENLTQILRRGPITPERAARIGAQVADALAAAHRLGMVHRDVKPSNILVEAEDRAKLMDFGIARTVDDATLTRTGHMIGSVAYMAPEVARGEAVTPAADLYSLGATLFAAVEGHSPFAAMDDSSTSVAMLVRLVTQSAPPATNAGPLTDLIGRLLAAPDMRPSATEAATQLRSAPAGSPSPARVVPDEEPEDESTEPTRIRQPAPAPPVAVVASTEPPMKPVDEIAAGSTKAGLDNDRTVLRPHAPTPAGPTSPASPVLIGPPESGRTPEAQPAAPQRPPVTPRPPTPIQKQDRRRRRALVMISILVVFGLAGSLVAYPAWQNDQIAARVANTAFLETEVRQIAQGLADQSKDSNDSFADFAEVVVTVLIQSRIGQTVAAEKRTTALVEARAKILAGSTDLYQLLDDPVTRDFANDYVDVAANLEDVAFTVAFEEKMKSTPIWVNPRYGVWDPQTGRITTPNPSATPS